MNFSAYAGIGILLVLSIIGLVILLRQDSFKSENNKKIYIATGGLQAVHAGLYLAGILDKIAQANANVAFGICATLSFVCIVMAIWMLRPSSNFKHGVKYLMMFIAIFQVISTIVIFFMPD